MTERELKTRLKYWQKILRLQDWDVSIRYNSAVDMAENNQGQIYLDCASRRAMINILQPNEYRTPIDKWKQDIDNTIIHELLHIITHFWTVESGSIDYILKEQAIDIVARSLVLLDTQTRPSSAQGG